MKSIQCQFKCVLVFLSNLSLLDFSQPFDFFIWKKQAENSNSFCAPSFALPPNVSLYLLQVLQTWYSRKWLHNVIGSRGGRKLFQTPIPLLLQKFKLQIRVRIWKFFKFENPNLVQTPATIDPTKIYPCFYLRNSHSESCYCRKWKVTPDPGPVLHTLLTPDRDPKEKRRILPESTRAVCIQSHGRSKSVKSFC